MFICCKWRKYLKPKCFFMMSKVTSLVKIHRLYVRTNDTIHY